MEGIKNQIRNANISEYKNLDTQELYNVLKDYISPNDIDSQYIFDVYTGQYKLKNKNIKMNYEKLVTFKVNDPIVLSVMKDLNNRSTVGIKKYNTTLDRKDLNMRDWLQHAYEEALDLSNYLKRCIMELEENAK